MKKSVKIVLSVVFIILVSVVIFMNINKSIKTTNKTGNLNENVEQQENVETGEIIYGNTIGLAFGSIRIRIYDNGVVEEDKEIEDPNHQVKYKEIKRLTNEEVNELKIKISELNEYDLEKFVNKLVYGKETPGNTGF